MPKRSGTARGSAQRHKVKTQKSIELVHPEGERQESSPLEDESNKPFASSQTATIVETPETEEVEEQKLVTPKGSAAARIAERRRAMQKANQRQAASLLSPDNFSYVKKDLVTIGILSTFLFAAIIVLYFAIGRA